MLTLLFGITTRIVSNSYLNVFQKLLTNKGEKASVINFYTYLGLSVIGFLFCSSPVFNTNILQNIIFMGVLGALGNYYIIKALSCGELSSIAPLNSYKPIVALILAFFLLNEIPGINALLGLILIILGTFIISDFKFLYSRACFYRILALIFSGCEAVFIKKVILLSNIESAFLYWALAGLIFSAILALKHPIKIARGNIKYQIYLILAVSVMQYSTNFVFAKMNVAYALALFQLSTLLSVFLGVSIFKEKNLKKKLIGSLIMITGAILILLF